jgi:hypothetical protein
MDIVLKADMIVVILDLKKSTAFLSEIQTMVPSGNITELWIGEKKEKSK